MPQIDFVTISSTIDGVNASTGKQTEQAFNNNFALAKSLLEQLFAVAGVSIISEQMTSIKVDTTTTPYTLSYTLDDPSGSPTWIPLISVGFADLTGNPTDNIALNTALSSKGSASDVATLQTQMTAAQGNISNLQTTVSNQGTTIGAHTSAITALQSSVNDRVRTPHGDTLYLRYVQATGAVQYSVDGSTWVDILSSGVSFGSISGNAGDNASLVSYVAAQIAAALTTIGNTYVLQTTYNGHVTDYNNPHNVTKADVGLGNVDNTADLDKPISTAVQQALNNITSNMPPIYSLTPSDYRTLTPGPEVGSVYFTSNSFIINN